MESVLLLVTTLLTECTTYFEGLKNLGLVLCLAGLVHQTEQLAGLLTTGAGTGNLLTGTGDLLTGADNILVTYVLPKKRC